MQILNQTKQTVVAQKAILADTFSSRLKGLLGRDKLSPQEALIIARCNSIHMFFMRFPLDVIFVDQDKRVVGLVENIKPFALSPVFWESFFAVEVSVGTIKLTHTTLGDRLNFDLNP